MDQLTSSDCIYCGEEVEDLTYTVSKEDGSLWGVAHHECYEKDHARQMEEVERDYQAGLCDWHLVNGKIEKRQPQLEKLNKLT